MSIKDLWERARERVEEVRKRGGRIVFTNGVFDIIHPGHVEVLRHARSLGDILVVGINSDESVRRLKGNRRPILNLEERMIVISSVRYVDIVVPFEEDTPYRLIQYLRPHVIVKGGDYRPEEVVGGDMVEEVVIVPLKEGISTSAIVERIKERYC